MRNISLAMLTLMLAMGCGESMTATDAATPRPDTGSGGTDSGRGTDAAPIGNDSGSSDSGSSDSGSSSDSGASDAGSTLDCATYCSRIMTNCTGDNAMYGSMNLCMTTCAGFPEGTLADTGGNTLGCRIYHAGAAVGDPATHCRHAGPGGDGACGGNCESFCHLATAICGTQYPLGELCITQCGAYPATPPYSAMTTSGNSLACRLYHLTAASSDAAAHCQHTGMASDTCE